MFRELGKGVWFYAHVVGGAIAGYLAATIPNGDPRDSGPQWSATMVVATVIGAAIGSALWVVSKRASDESGDENVG